MNPLVHTGQLTKVYGELIAVKRLNVTSQEPHLEDIFLDYTEGHGDGR